MTVNISSVQQQLGQVSEIFPTPLYAMHDVLTSDQNQALVEKIHRMREVYGAGNISDWLSAHYSPDNCFKLASLSDFVEFGPLIERVTAGVQEFARYFGCSGTYECSNSWYNVYTTGKYQEFHIHPNEIFSAVYFLKVPENAPGIYFKRPGSGPMLPPKDIGRESPYHREFAIAPPREGTVVIFRSDLYHSVPPEEFEGERVTIALNFR